jgi:hypothetical protein
VNDDDHPDVVFARGGVTNRVCLGRGDGTFRDCADVGSETEDSLAVALGDVNGDGKLDAVFANVERIPAADPPTRNRVCLGDGAGGFACQQVSPDSNRFHGVALGDVNEDSNVDALFATNNQQKSRLCLGDGTGQFTCSDMPADSQAARAVSIADLDGDRHLDAVFANASEFSDPARICYGDGLGTFDCALAPNIIETHAVAVGQLAW